MKRSKNTAGAAAAFLLLLLNTPLCASVVMQASVDKNKITIGDRVTYRVVIEYDPGTEIKFPDPGASLGHFEIKDFKVGEPRTKFLFRKFRLKKRKIVEYEYLVTTFTTGEYRIPAITVPYISVGGEEKEIKSGEITVSVESVSADGEQEDIRDIKPPVGIPRGWLYYFLLVIIPLLLAGAGAGYYFYTRRQAEDILAGKQEDNRPPHEIACERLSKLAELGLIEQGRIKEHYVLLSEIIRQYLEKRFGISVLDKTTTELFRQLREVRDIEKKNVGTVRDFLEQCDLVKFARHIPGADVIKKDTDTAKMIIDVTKKVMQEAVSTAPS